MKEFGPYIFAMSIGFLWGFNLFWLTPKDVQRIKAEGAVAVYEGRATCEKLFNQWICNMPKE